MRLFWVDINAADKSLYDLGVQRCQMQRLLQFALDRAAIVRFYGMRQRAGFQIFQLRVIPLRQFEKQFWGNPSRIFVIV